jgi:putative PIN family toxin of toxin-antitoxin system
MPSARRPPKAVVDTNLFVSGLISKRGAPAEILQLWRNGAFTLLVSRDQRDEIGAVINRPRIAEKYGISEQDRTDLMRLIDTVAVKAPLKRRLPVAVRDPKDDMILASALGGKADFLVTGDDDLLVLRDNESLGKLQIVTAREFLDFVAGSTGAAK